jgi:hypothetical protein
MQKISPLIATMRHERDRAKISERLVAIAEARVDIVAPQASVRVNAVANTARLFTTTPVITASGVHPAGKIEAALNRTSFADFANRLGIPLQYLDRIIGAGHGDLASININTLTRRDDRKAFYRFLNVEDEWLLRAVVSDTYRPIDNLDLLVAVAQGMSNADQSLDDAEVEVDWTMDRFRMRVAIPSVAVVAPDLFGDYRMPFTMDQTRDMHAPPSPGEVPPVLWAGFEFSNSETGGGAVVVAPRAMVLRCRNGLTETRDVLRKIHAGERLEEGMIAWSEETRRLSLELLTSEIADAVKTFADVDYLHRIVERMRRAKGVEVERPTESVQVLGTALGFTETQTRNVLDCFMRGGDSTVLGLGQAVTAAAQLAENTDTQADMEAAFWQIVDSPEVYAR